MDLISRVCNRWHCRHHCACAVDHLMCKRSHNGGRTVSLVWHLFLCFYGGVFREIAFLNIVWYLVLIDYLETKLLAFQCRVYWALRQQTIVPSFSFRLGFTSHGRWRERMGSIETGSRRSVETHGSNATLRTKYNFILLSHYGKICSFSFPTSYMNVYFEKVWLKNRLKKLTFEKNCQAIVKDRFNWPHSLVQLTLTIGGQLKRQKIYFMKLILVCIKICLKSDFALLVRKPKHHSFSWCRAFFNMAIRSCCTRQYSKSGSSGPALPYMALFTENLAFVGNIITWRNLSSKKLWILWGEPGIGGTPATLSTMVHFIKQAWYSLQSGSETVTLKCYYNLHVLKCCTTPIKSADIY